MTVRYSRWTLFLLVKVILPVSLFAGKVRAENLASIDVPPIPEGMEKLEEALSTSVEINSRNYERYQSLIVPELIPLLQNGSLSISALRKLNFSWQLDDEWEQNSREASSGGQTLVETVTQDIESKRGFIFGNNPGVNENQSRDDFAKKILWNTHSVWWSQKHLSIDFSLRSYEDRRFVSALKGTLVRIYPKTSQRAKQLPQLFRERVTLVAPSAIKGMGWLTFRFFGAEDDVVWTYSPALQKVRQLTSSNRADPLVNTLLSLDDLLTWSGRPESLVLSSVDKVVLLAPFPSASPFSMKMTGMKPAAEEQDSQSEKNSSARTVQCATVESSEKAPLTTSNSLLSVWASKSIFVPRRMYRIEFTETDIYKAYGRQIVYIDTTMMLPLFKVVFDRTGKLMRIIASAYGLAQNTIKAPFLSHTLATTGDEGIVSLFESTRTLYCPLPTRELNTHALDPNRMNYASGESTPH